MADGDDNFKSRDITHSFSHLATAIVGGIRFKLHEYDGDSHGYTIAPAEGELDRIRTMIGHTEVNKRIKELKSLLLEQLFQKIQYQPMMGRINTMCDTAASELQGAKRSAIHGRAIQIKNQLLENQTSREPVVLPEGLSEDLTHEIGNLIAGKQRSTSNASGYNPLGETVMELLFHLLGKEGVQQTFTQAADAVNKELGLVHSERALTTVNAAASHQHP